MKFDLEQALLKLMDNIDIIDLSVMPFCENSIISELKHIKPLCFAFSKNVPYLERLTINRNLPNNNNETVSELKLLKNPPIEVLKVLNKYGRANLKGQSVLYATFILPTLLLETRPEADDLVTISKWKLKKENTPLVVYPIIDYPKCQEYQLCIEFEKALQQCPKELQKIAMLYNCMIAKCFSKYVEKGKEINYTFSAHFSDRIFNEMYGGKFEAIIYPSVQDSGITSNIAIKPDVFNEKYEIDEISESVVYSNDRHSLILKSIKSTKKVDSTGKIIWE